MDAGGRLGNSTHSSPSALSSGTFTPKDGYGTERHAIPVERFSHNLRCHFFKKERTRA
jgi:hypothetical protein